jgi:hypothetical protein
MEWSIIFGKEMLNKTIRGVISFGSFLGRNRKVRILAITAIRIVHSFSSNFSGK